MADRFHSSIPLTKGAGTPKIQEPRWLRINNLAVLLSAGYLLLCSAYIWLSGVFASQFSQSIQELYQIELVKGLGFVVITTLFFYFFARIVLGQLERNRRQIVQQQEALMDAEKRALIGLVTASIAHDIRNIVTVINAQTYKLSRSMATGANVDEIYARLTDAERRLKGMVRRFSLVGQQEILGELTEFDLVELARRHIDFIRAHERVEHCTLTLKCDGRVTITGNSTLIEQMLLNLILNAADATDNRGTIEVRVHGENGTDFIEVHDNGKGISVDEQMSLFDLFFTTKDDGHGLGLFTVKACVELHQGAIQIFASPLGGACFQVALPARGVEYSA